VPHLNISLAYDGFLYSTSLDGGDKHDRQVQVCAASVKALFE
jgi:hypothetical protein